MNSRPDYRVIVHSLVRAIILVGIAFYIVHLNKIGHLQLYIAPRMSLYTKLAATGLYLIAAVLVYQALREWNGQRSSGCEDDCDHPPSGSWLKHTAVYGLFAIPLAIFSLSPDTTIGSAMASQKGMNLNSAVALKEKSAALDRKAGLNQTPAASPSATSSSGQTNSSPTLKTAPAAPEPAVSELDRLFPHDSLTEPYAKYALKLYKQPTIEIKEKSYLEILTTLDFFLDQFVDHRVTLSGFVYRDKTIETGRFVLGRFAVQCCTADALPYGIVVDSPDEKLYANDDWMTITGTLSKTTYNGNEVMLLKADKAVKIKPGKDPYVYPDLDFGQ